jgi:DegV family protein with EDD domain
MEFKMAQGKIAIVTDSTAYIPDELINEYNIHVIPLNVNWRGKSFLDNVDITPEEFYKKLQAESEIPTTSQPSAGAFQSLFLKLSEDYEGVVAVLISSDLSGTIASALAAKGMVGDFPVEVVDSRLTTMALGFPVLKAAEVARAGGSLAEVADAARSLVGKIRVMFVVDTLEYLHKGGRIGGAKRLLGSLLAMKPLLELVDGKIDSLDSVRTKKKAIQAMLSIFENDAAGKDKIHLTVFHGVAEVDADQLRETILKSYQPETIIMSKLSPVLGVHTGPGTVGIAYYFD